MRYYLGVDWADQTDAVWSVDEDETKIAARTVPHTAEVLSEWARELDEWRAQGIALWAAIERPEGGVESGESKGCRRSWLRASTRYSITWFARCSRVCGIVSLSALAVFRLITSSNVLGCSTGRSIGFAPLKILST